MQTSQTSRSLSPSQLKRANFDRVRVLIAGLGYVGLPLGMELSRQGHEVFGLRRFFQDEAGLRRLGIHPIAADITNPADFKRLPPQFDWVVNAVSSGKGGAEEYRRIYLDGMRNLIDWLRPVSPQKFVYTSSTSVYAHTKGEAVSEESAAEPASETSRILIEAEQLLLKAASELNFPGVVLRVAGIYGPGRGHLLQQYLRHEARIEGAGERWINMIHLDDLVGVIVAALRNGRKGQIYNAADGEPVKQLEFFHWLSSALKKPMPPFSPEPGGRRKRAWTSKRVQNLKLRTELGYRFKYPTFREGYAAEIQRVKNAGELIEPGSSNEL